MVTNNQNAQVKIGDRGRFVKEISYMPLTIITHSSAFILN